MAQESEVATPHAYPDAAEVERPATMQRTRSVTFANGSEPRSRPSSGSSVASRPTSREAQGGGRGSTGKSMSLDAQLVSESDASLDERLSASRPDTQNVVECPEVHRLSQVRHIARLSQAGQIPRLQLEKRRSMNRRASFASQGRGPLTPSSRGHMSPTSSCAVSTPGRQVPGGALHHAKSGFTPRFLPEGYRKARWARGSISGASEAMGGRHSISGASEPAAAARESYDRRKEIHQKYSTAWRETEALMDEYSALRDMYELKWLGVRRPEKPTSTSKEEGAQSIDPTGGNSPFTASSPERPGRGSAIGNPPQRRSPFVDEYRERKAQIAAALYAESDEGIAAAEKAASEAAQLEEACVELLGLTSSESDAQLRKLRQRSPPLRISSAARHEHKDRPSNALRSMPPANESRRLSRPESAPQLKMYSRLPVSNGNRLAESTAANRAAAVSALSIHGPRADKPRTLAGTRPSHSEPRTATEMRIKMLAQFTCRETTMARGRNVGTGQEDIRASRLVRARTSASDSPIVHSAEAAGVSVTNPNEMNGSSVLRSGPCLGAQQMGSMVRNFCSTAPLPLQASASATTLRVGGTGKRPTSSGRLLSSASQPIISATEWRIRPGSSPAI